ncbi:MAG: hypothetical protein EA401_05925 [Planctomycetota bacterium]|nr:MAG: hypothetical protein EA401_05925 [Planctomycetota bacterium]
MRLLPDSGSVVYPIIGLILFTSLFLLLLIYLLTDRRRDHHRRMEALALDDGTDGPESSQSRQHPSQERQHHEL